MFTQPPYLTTNNTEWRQKKDFWGESAFYILKYSAKNSLWISDNLRKGNIGKTSDRIVEDSFYYLKAWELARKTVFEIFWFFWGVYYTKMSFVSHDDGVFQLWVWNFHCFFLFTNNKSSEIFKPPTDGTLMEGGLGAKLFATNHSNGFLIVSKDDKS